MTIVSWQLFRLEAKFFTAIGPLWFVGDEKILTSMTPDWHLRFISHHLFRHLFTRFAMVKRNPPKIQNKAAASPT